MQPLAVWVAPPGRPPLPHPPSQGAVIHPLRHPPHPPVLSDGIHALLAVRFPHPGRASAWALAGPGSHGRQGANLRSIPLAPAPAVLRVEGFEEARHGPLPELVFSGGASQRTRRALPLGTSGSSDACGPVPFLLQALDEAGHGLFQGLLVCLGASLRPPRSGLLPDGPLALGAAVLSTPPLAGAEPMALWTCRLLRSSRPGGGPWGSAPACSGPGSCAGSVCLSAPSPSERLARLGVR